MSQPIRFTAATRRQYTVVTWAVVAVVLLCTVGSIAVHHEGAASVAGACITAVVVGGVALGLLAFDRSNSTYTLDGTVLQSRGRRVDLTQVTSAQLVDRNAKALGTKWSTLTLTDAAGGKVRMMVTSKRVTHLYEPEDVRTIADLLARSPLPDAQGVAQQLHAFAAETGQGQSDIDLSL